MSFVPKRFERTLPNKLAELRIEDDFSYRSTAGTCVFIPRAINPYVILGVPQNCSYGKAKNAFRNKINTPNRQKRAEVSLAYDMVTKKLYARHLGRYDYFGSGQMHVKNTDHIFYALIGDKAALEKQIRNDPDLLTKADEESCTVLYIASRAGFVDVTTMILGLIKNEEGHLKKAMGRKSSALHAASFYGHHAVVGLLLEYGVNPEDKNKYGSTASKEAKDVSVAAVFTKFNEDTIGAMASEMSKASLSVKVKIFTAKSPGVEEVIAKEIERAKPASLDDDAWKACKTKWRLFWHGTKTQNVRSIFEFGLHGAGDALPDGTVIKGRPGRAVREVIKTGSGDEAKAVYVTPSVLYAAHPMYSEEILSQKVRWQVVLKVRVRTDVEDASKAPVLTSFEPVLGEPETSEYVVSSKLDGARDRITQIMNTKGNMEVQSVMFLKVKFLENLSKYGIGHYDHLIETLSQDDH